MPVATQGKNPQLSTSCLAFSRCTLCSSYSTVFALQLQCPMMRHCVEPFSRAERSASSFTRRKVSSASARAMPASMPSIPGAVMTSTSIVPNVRLAHRTESVEQCRLSHDSTVENVTFPSIIRTSVSGNRHYTPVFVSAQVMSCSEYEAPSFAAHDPESFALPVPRTSQNGCVPSCGRARAQRCSLAVPEEDRRYDS